MDANSSVGCPSVARLPAGRSGLLVALPGLASLLLARHTRHSYDQSLRTIALVLLLATSAWLLACSQLCSEFLLLHQHQIYWRRAIRIGSMFLAHEANTNKDF